MAWTDERLDDLARHIDARFDSIDRRFEQVDRRFDRLEDTIHADITELQSTFLRVGGGVIIALIGVIAAVIAAG